MKRGITQIEIRGKVFDIRYTYHPAERQDQLYPGDAEYVEIDGISYRGEDFTEFLLDEIPALEERLLNLR
jgi:hypothetical protein